MIKNLVSFFLVFSFSYVSMASIPSRSNLKLTQEEADQQCVKELERYIESFNGNEKELVKILCEFSGQNMETHQCELTQNIIVKWMNNWYTKCMQRKGF